MSVNFSSPGLWDEEKHPRGEHGRWSSSSGVAQALAIPKKAPASTDVAQPVELPDHATSTILMNRTVKEDAEMILGRPVRKAHLANLAGSPEGSEVEITSDGAAVYIISNWPDGTETERTIHTENGKLVIHNDMVEVPEGVQGMGQGSEMVARQFAQAIKLGVDRIEMAAAGRGRYHEQRDGKTSFVGFKVWPKFGYDGEIPERCRNVMPEKIVYTEPNGETREEKAPWRSAKTVQELYAMPGGKQVWEEYGSTFNAHIDLDNKKQMRMLRNYLRKKGFLLPGDRGEESREATFANQMMPVQTNRRSGEEPILDAGDEQLLDELLINEGVVSIPGLEFSPDGKATVRSSSFSTAKPTGSRYGHFVISVSETESDNLASFSLIVPESESLDNRRTKAAEKLTRLRMAAAGLRQDAISMAIRNLRMNQPVLFGKTADYPVMVLSDGTKIYRAEPGPTSTDAACFATCSDVPDDCIWLRTDLPSGDVPYAITREYLKRRMVQKGMDTQAAADIALRVEFRLRATGEECDPMWLRPSLADELIATENGSEVHFDWDESLHPRDHGKFAPKGTVTSHGGGEEINVGPDRPGRSPDPLHPKTAEVLQSIQQKVVENEKSQLDTAARGLNDWLDQGAGVYKETVDPEELRSKFQKLFDEAEFTINFDPYQAIAGEDPDQEGYRTVADQMEADPNLRNLFETTHGGGNTNQQVRESYETNMFGKAVSSVPQQDRPKYGAINWSGTKHGAANRYGEAVIVLNQGALKDRMTLAPNDSELCQDYEIGTGNNPINSLLRSKNSWAKLGYPQSAITHATDDQYHDYYDEFQVWGHVPISQQTVKEIRLPDYRMTPSGLLDPEWTPEESYKPLLKLAKREGIKVTFYDPYDI